MAGSKGLAKTQDFLILLGNTNDEQGRLSETAVLRAETAFHLWKENTDCLILPTGSFGGHFNKYFKPHGKLLASYLIGKGVPSDALLPHTRTAGTLEDALGVLRVLSQAGPVGKVYVVTSEFHMPRVKFIFGQAIERYNLEFIQAPDPTDGAHRKKCLKEERRKIRKTKREWVDLTRFDPKRFPGDSYTKLGGELIHYDNISYFPIVGAILVASFVLSKAWPSNITATFLIHVGGAIIVFAFWYIYLRLANTAASARRTLSRIEELYSVPGLSATQNKTSVLGMSPTVKQTIGLVFLVILLVIVIQFISLMWPSKWL